MFQKINEPIQVITRFSDGKITPLKFLWNNRLYSVEKLNLTYHHYEGRTKLYYFAVSDSVNYFKMQFDSNTLNWILLETYSE